MESITEQEIRREKAELRAQLRRQLTAIPPEEMRAGDDLLFARFLALPQVEQARTIFLYWGMAGLEIDTSRLVPMLVERGKRVCVPRTASNRTLVTHWYRPGDKLEKTAYGIMEPDPESPVAEKGEIELALVPSMCYDRGCYRLGFGAGYYDRWLADFSGVTVGLCREKILRHALPVEPHDRPVDILLTERETFLAERAGG